MNTNDLLSKLANDDRPSIGDLELQIETWKLNYAEECKASAEARLHAAELEKRIKSMIAYAKSVGFYDDDPAGYSNQIIRGIENISIGIVAE